MIWWVLAKAPIWRCVSGPYAVTPSASHFNLSRRMIGWPSRVIDILWVHDQSQCSDVADAIIIDIYSTCLRISAADLLSRVQGPMRKLRLILVDAFVARLKRRLRANSSNTVFICALRGDLNLAAVYYNRKKHSQGGVRIWVSVG